MKSKNNININTTYQITASLGILLQFQQKYSYSQDSKDVDTDINNNDFLLGLEQLNKLYKEPENEREYSFTVLWIKSIIN